MAELKPCPFCGCTYIRVVREGVGITERHRAICARCSAQINRITHKSAIEAWNRRYTPEEIDFDYGAEDE